MDFKKVAIGVTSYSNYCMMRDSGSPADELDYFRDHIEMEKQYRSNVSPDELGRAIIDSQCGVLQ